MKIVILLPVLVELDEAHRPPKPSSATGNSIAPSNADHWPALETIDDFGLQPRQGFAQRVMVKTAIVLKNVAQRIVNLGGGILLSLIHI